MKISIEKDIEIRNTLLACEIYMRSIAEFELDKTKVHIRLFRDNAIFNQIEFSVWEIPPTYYQGCKFIPEEYRHILRENNNAYKQLQDKGNAVVYIETKLIQKLQENGNLHKSAIFA